MKKANTVFAALFVLCSLCSCGIRQTPVSPPVNSSSQSSSSKQKSAPEFAFDSINQYIKYNLPSALIDGRYNKELGYLGGNLFCRKDTGSCAAEEASESTPPGWSSYGGVEMYDKLNCQFNGGQLTDVSQPWNHSEYLTKAEPVDHCTEPAVLVKVSFDLYPVPEALEKHIDKGKQTSTMWYVFFAKEGSEISYAIFLNADYYSKEDIVSLAQSVKFTDNAFSIAIKK